MLDRIRRKLFLSVKVMGSDNPAGAENASLGSSELMEILRRGSSALSSTDDGMDLARFLDAGIGEILAASRVCEDGRDAKIHQELKAEPGAEVDARLLRDAEAEERTLLSGVAQVRCRLFEGRVVGRAQKNEEIAREWQNLQKRARVDRVVTVDGMPFLSAQVGPEAVRVFDVSPSNGMLMVRSMIHRV